MYHIINFRKAQIRHSRSILNILIPIFLHCNEGAPVAQWVKRWPADLAVPILRRNLLNRKRDPIAHSLSLSSAHRPVMTEIQCAVEKDVLTDHPSIHTLH